MDLRGGLTTEAAASCYRAFAHAAQTDPLPWGLLEPAAREGWLRVVRSGGLVLQAKDGRPAREMGEALRELFGAPEGAPAFALPWEAAARHLFALIDSDDIDDLPALEQSWREWARNRLQKAGAT